MSKTKIEWAERVWNPVRGCSRVSEGCRNCYAERQAARFSGPGEPFHGFAKVVAPRDHMDRVGGRRDGWTGRVDLINEKLADPMRWRKPARVFVNSMSDLFHESLPAEAIDRVFAVMALAPQHTFIVLTKRPERMRSWFSRVGPDGHVATRVVIEGRGLRPDHWAREWPLPNVWLGVSVEDQATADKRIPHLLATPAAKRFVSYEPALGPVDFAGEYGGSDWLGDPRDGLIDEEGIDWLIVGGESGPGARPCEVAWIRSAVQQCKAAGVACFVKQLGARPIARGIEDMGPAVFSAWDLEHSGEPFPICGVDLPLRSRKGSDPSEWPEDLRVRELP